MSQLLRYTHNVRNSFFRYKYTHFTSSHLLIKEARRDKLAWNTGIKITKRRRDTNNLFAIILDNITSTRFNIQISTLAA